VQPSPEDSAADKDMRDAFKKIAGEDMEIDAYELQDILNAAFAKGAQIFCHFMPWLLQTFRRRQCQCKQSVGKLM